MTSCETWIRRSEKRRFPGGTERVWKPEIRWSSGRSVAPGEDAATLREARRNRQRATPASETWVTSTGYMCGTSYKILNYQYYHDEPPRRWTLIARPVVKIHPGMVIISRVGQQQGDVSIFNVNNPYYGSILPSETAVRPLPGLRPCGSVVKSCSPQDGVLHGCFTARL